MRRLAILTFVVLTALVAGPTGEAGPSPTGPNSDASQLESAINKEIIDGNVAGAIEDYERLSTSNDRVVAATALGRLATLYGRSRDPQARQVNERLAKDFGELPVGVAAKARLDAGAQAVPGQRASAAPRIAWSVTEPAIIYGGLSADGRYAAYGNFRDGNLYVHNLGTKKNIRITNTPDRGREHSEGAAQFSRDGKRLAYDWFGPADGGGSLDRLCELRVVDFDGQKAGQYQVLVRNPEYTFIEPYGWTPDGASIVVQVRRRIDRALQLGLVSTKDKTIKILLSNDWKGGGVFVSPDGRSIAFDAEQEGTKARDIFVLATNATRKTPVVVDPANDDVLVGWSPDGQRLLFTSKRSDSLSLYSVRFTEDSRPSEPELVRRNVPSFAYSLGVTAAGSLLVYSPGNVSASSTYVWRIKTASIDFASGRVLSAPVTAVADFVNPNNRPQWSPDGKYLSWLSVRGTAPTPEESYLMVRSLGDGKVQEWRLNGGVNPEGLQWTPDSLGMMIFGGDGEGHSGVSRIDVQTGVRSPVASGGPFRSENGLRSYSAPWSTDPTKFYFWRNAPTVRVGALVERDMTSGTERTLFTRSDSGKLSPDKRYWYYTRPIPGGRQASYLAVRSDGSRTPTTLSELALIERDVASGAERELTRTIGAALSALWPGAQQLAMRSFDPASKTWSIGLFSARDGSYRELMRNEQPMALIPSPDGRSGIVSVTNALGADEKWWVSTDGRGRQRLPELDNAPDERIEIHPDGRRVVFMAQSGQRSPDEVWTIDNVAPASSAKR